MRVRRRVRPSTQTTLVVITVVIAFVWFVVALVARRLGPRRFCVLVLSLATFVLFGVCWAGIPDTELQDRPFRPTCIENAPGTYQGIVCDLEEQ